MVVNVADQSQPSDAIQDLFPGDKFIENFEGKFPIVNKVKGIIDFVKDVQTSDINISINSETLLSSEYEIQRRGILTGSLLGLRGDPNIHVRRKHPTETRRVSNDLIDAVKKGEYKFERQVFLNPTSPFVKEPRFILKTNDIIEKETERPLYLQYALELVSKIDNEMNTVQKHIKLLAKEDPAYAVSTLLSLAALSERFYTIGKIKRTVSFDMVKNILNDIDNCNFKIKRDGDTKKLMILFKTLTQEAGIFNLDNHSDFQEQLSEKFGYKYDLERKGKFRDRYTPTVVFKSSEYFMNNNPYIIKNIGNIELLDRLASHLGNRFLSEHITAYCAYELPKTDLVKY